MNHQLITPNLSVGGTPPEWLPVDQLSLLILVGVTGVGKSTLLSRLTTLGLNYHLLPDRRMLTDKLIIAPMQQEAGEPIAVVTDRQQRFAYTRAYRRQYSGGMVHALSQLWVSAKMAHSPVLFDGLRGKNEVDAALTQLPMARFVVLDAPDSVRVKRLLGRNDSFDQVARHTPNSPLSATERISDASTVVPQPQIQMLEAANLFDAQEIDHLIQWCAEQKIGLDALRAKIEIVATERRNYDPAATLNSLRIHAAGRMLYLDTTAASPTALAQTLVEWVS